MKVLITVLLGALATAAIVRAQPAHAEGRRLALVVGTSTYVDPSWAGLANAASDAERVADLLERRFAYDVTRVIDGDRDTFKRALAAVSEAAAEADDLLVFVAGHGHFDPTDKAGYLVFADADPTCDRGCYPLDNVKRALFGTRARHVLVMLDACYAGTFDPSVAFGGGSFARRGAIVPAHLRQILRDHAAARSRLVFASVGRAPTLDGTPGQSHSPFARIFLAELERAVTAGAVSIDRIAIVMKEGPEPLPVLAPTSFPAALPHDVNGTFLFVAAADLCTDLERVLAAARKTTSETTGAPAWGHADAIDPPLVGASRCLRQRFATDGADLLRCRFGRFPEAEIDERRRALEKRLALCVAATDAGATPEVACEGGTCGLSVAIDLARDMR